MNLWEQLKERHKLVKAFKKSGLHLGNEERYIFPKIRTITPQQITLTLPIGLDPKIISKNFYVFQQVYGEHIEVKYDNRNITLTLSKMPKELKYDYESLIPSFQMMKLPIVVGIDKTGKLLVYDMVKYPHLLIAGETGSGKSTQVRSILSTLIQALPPERLKLYLADLKLGEFHLFKRIKHVKGPFITVRELLPILEELKLEMRKRGNLLDRYEVAHIDDLPQKLPYIVLCIDEVGLLQKEQEIMNIVEEISAIGRALGVFLILSMQRPDSKVLDGKLKVNLTVRMGFKTADKINARIQGTPGSEKIKQEGKFLIKIPLYDEPTEILAPFLPLEKAKKILEGFRSNKSKNVNMSHLNTSDDVLTLKENENGIFEVLD